jgi:hypothetical protein
MKKYQNKVVELQNLFKFAVDSYFIWIHLRSQTFNSHLVSYNIWTTNYNLNTRYVLGGVIEEATCEGEVACSIPMHRIMHEKYGDLRPP